MRKMHKRGDKQDTERGCLLGRQTQKKKENRRKNK